MRMTKYAHWLIGLGNILFYVLFIAILGMLGYLAQKHQYEADWTFGNRQTLTASTQQILRSLQEPLVFTAYVPGDARMQAALQRRVSKYQRFKADTKLETVNPELEPERAERDGIQYQGQVVISVGKRREVVESLSEKTVANALQRLSRTHERQIIFLEGHDEREPLAQHSQGMSELTRFLRNKGFAVQPHNLIRTGDVPENTSVLVVAAPKTELTPAEADIMRGYVEQGGNLLWLHDPGLLHGMDVLESDLGLILNEDPIVEADDQARAVPGINHPAVIPVIDFNNSEIAGNINKAIFPLATPIERDEQVQADFDHQDFLMTLPTSWMETGELEGNIAYEAENGDKPGPLSIGVSLIRDLAPTQGNQHRQQRIVVIGDSDFMLNSFIGQADNLALANAIFNWLAEDDNLVNIEITKAPDATLDLPGNTLYALAVIFLFVAPVLLVAIGLGIWFRRRSR